MKKTILLLAMFICGLKLVHAQAWLSSNIVSASSTWKELDSRVSLDGGMLTFGYFAGMLTSADGDTIESKGGRDYYLINFSKHGNVEWMRNYGSNESDYITGGLTSDTLGNIYISGGFRGLLKASDTDSISSTASYDMFIIKLDESGNTVWARNAGAGAGLQASTALETDPYGDLIMAGIFNDSIQIYDQETLYAENASPDYFFGKFRPSDGRLDWIKHGKSLHASGGRIEKIYADTLSYLFTGSYNDSISLGMDTLLSVSSNSDVHLVSTDLEGEISWIRKIRGVGSEFSYSLAKDEEGNIYLSGDFASDTLLVDSNHAELIKLIGNKGSSDLFIAKYRDSGDLEWIQTTGSRGTDKSYYMEYFENKVYVSGSFSDTLTWGSDTLISSGLGDVDMFKGALDLDGNFIYIKQYRFTAGSDETGKDFFKTDEETLTLIRTNAARIEIADSTYVLDGTSFYMVLGIGGCLPISIDNVITRDVSTCYGDSTGSIQIFSSGGFGGPFSYSIDNGQTFSKQSTLYQIPAGNYQIVVMDKERCKKSGDMETLTQPDSLSIELVSVSRITETEDGAIVVAALGGIAPYTFTLKPNNIEQGFGTFTFGPEESGAYVVEVTDSNGCGPVATDTIVMAIVSDGVDLSELGLKLYPNPSQGIITLEIPFDGVEATLEVLSLTGQVMYSRQAHSSGGMINETFDLTSLSKGMYMIRVNGQTLKSGVVLN